MRAMELGRGQINPEHAVRLDELEPCSGNPGAACASGVTAERVQGFDDRWRCVACQRLHVELVMREAGERDPTTIASAQNAVATPGERVAAHQSVARRLESFVNGHRGQSVTFDMTNPETVREMRSFEARAPQKVGETNQARAHRLQAAFREKMRARRAGKAGR